MNIEDNIIVLNSNNTGVASVDAGITIERGASDDAHIMWNETTNKFNLLEGSSAADLVIGDLTVSEIALTNELPLSMGGTHTDTCLLYTSPSPRDRTRSRMPSSA